MQKNVSCEIRQGITNTERNNLQEKLLIFTNCAKKGKTGHTQEMKLLKRYVDDSVHYQGEPSRLP